jgi:putative tryptophan/tyrosine transport system substrate-binding protein
MLEIHFSKRGRRMKKGYQAISFALAGMLMLVGCNSNNSESNPRKTAGTYNGLIEPEGIEHVIGVLQFGENAQLDDSTSGFMKALKDAGLDDSLNSHYDIQIANFDKEKSKSIAEKFVKDKVDIIFANAPESALTALEATTEIPIVFTSVPDPISAGLVKSLDAQEGNITGTTTTSPDTVPLIMDFMTARFGAKNIGVLFQEGQPQSEAIVSQVEDLAKVNGSTITAAPVSKSEDVKVVAESLIGKVDAFFIPNDSTIVLAFDTIVEIANQNKIPLFVDQIDLLQKGAMAASGIDYFDLGFQTGTMALNILLGGKSPSELPIQVPDRPKLYINKKAVANQGITFNPDWELEAEIIEGK